MFRADPSTGERDGLAVVTLRGELDAAAAASAAAALSVATENARVVIVDLAGLEFIDCSGLAALASAAQRARRGGGDLLLAAPQQQVRRVLAITRMDGAFSLHAGVDEAASSQGQFPAPVLSPPVPRSSRRHDPAEAPPRGRQCLRFGSPALIPDLGPAAAR